MTPADASERAEIRALLTLDQLAGVGPRTAWALVRRFGSASAVLAAPERELVALAGAGATRERNDPELGARVERGLRLAERLGMQVLAWTSAEYPQTLLRLADPPTVLFLRGRAELLAAPGVTVVGARRATARARAVAERLGSALADAGETVISGMALGIDGAAHRGALARQGNTVVVLGRGADEPYPAAHRALFREVVRHGLVVSEFPPGTPPLPHHFPRRNRILAALGHTVVVVEAGSRSGSLITADHALDLGVDVWSVPGPIDRPASEGSNRLLGEGARPLVSVAAFVEAVTGRPAAAAAPRLRPPGPDGALLEHVGDEPTHVDAIATLAGMSVALALSRLTALEIGGWVVQSPGMRFRRAA